MRQKPPANEGLDEDKILWQRVTQHVTPLPGRLQKTAAPTPVETPAQKPAKTADKTLDSARKKKPQSRPTIAASIPPAASVKLVDLRQGDRAGLDGRTQRRLFRGDVPIDRRLDLHGHTAARAQVKLQSFIEDAAYSGCRCVLVITGKGAGVLQSHVPDWLKRAPLSGLVLALAEARRTDGGSGAFYVLLRRRR
jgi:DNA-nicking Smr family endonuclease